MYVCTIHSHLNTVLFCYCAFVSRSYCMYIQAQGTFCIYYGVWRVAIADYGHETRALVLLRTLVPLALASTCSRPSPSIMTRIPTEIWAHIVEFVPRADQRSCLFVSRMFHDLALSRLFAHVFVHFGLWTSQCDGRYPSDSMTTEEHEEMQRINSISWNVLRHISRNPSFASLVKKITVRAYSASEDSVWEQRMHYTLPAATELMLFARALRMSGRGTRSAS